MSPSSGYLPLARWHKAVLVFLAGLTLAFGVLVEVRTAFLQRPFGDLLVYLRAAWAVRVDLNPYIVTDHNGWHYNYPPLLAIVLTPLADPIPAIQDRTGYLPLKLTAAIWFLLNLGCLVWGVRVLARALEETSTDPWLRNQPPGCQSWWGLRVLPVLACLAPIGHTLMRGQVNLILLALLCGLVAATLRGRSFRAGLWLAGAICLKIIPAFLLLFPLWRRDRRCLLGCGVGLVVGLGLVPLAVFGTERTIGYYGDLGRTVLLPGLASGEDRSRAKELISDQGSHSQSLASILHHFVYTDRATRPLQPSKAIRLAHWGIGAVLTVLTLMAAGWQQRTGRHEVLFLGALALIMLLISPVSHLHYFGLALLALMGLVAGAFEKGHATGLTRGWWVLLIGYTLAGILPQLPQWEQVRDRGLLTGATLLLWGLTVAVMKKDRATSTAKTVRPLSALTKRAG